MIRSSKGGFSHASILKLTWRQFLVYLDAFGWVESQGTDDGRSESKEKDIYTMSREPKVKAAKKAMIEKDRARLKKHKEIANKPKEERRIINESNLLE